MNKAQQMLAKAGFPDTAAGRAAFHKQYPTPESFFQVHGGQDTEMYGAGSTIHIDPSKRGTFTAAATKHGKSVQGFASQVLANKEDYSPAMVKKANFARNAASWKHQDGGPVMYGAGGPFEEQTGEDPFAAGKSYLEGWQSSPMFKNIIQNQAEAMYPSNEKKAANYYKTFTAPMYIPQGKSLMGVSAKNNDPNMYVRYFPKDIIGIEKGLMDKDPALGNNLYTRAATMQYNPTTSVDFETILNTPAKTVKGEINEYEYGDPLKSDVHGLRQAGQAAGIYNPFTQPFKKEYIDQYNEFYKTNPSKNPLNQLLKFYTPDQVEYFMNNISQNQSTPGMNMQMAAVGGMVSDPPPYTEEEAINNARLSGQYYDRFSTNPGFGFRGPGSYSYFMDRLNNRNVKTVNPHQGVKDAIIDTNTITGSCEAGNCYEFADGGTVDALQLMGMPTPRMYGPGSRVESNFHPSLTLSTESNPNKSKEFNNPFYGSTMPSINNRTTLTGTVPLYSFNPYQRLNFVGSYNQNSGATNPAENYSAGLGLNFGEALTGAAGRYTPSRRFDNSNIAHKGHSFLDIFGNVGAGFTTQKGTYENDNATTVVPYYSGDLTVAHQMGRIPRVNQPRGTAYLKGEFKAVENPNQAFIKNNIPVNKKFVDDNYVRANLGGSYNFGKGLGIYGEAGYDFLRGAPRFEAGLKKTFADGGHVTDYSPSSNFGTVQSMNNTYMHGYGNGGPVGMYKKGGFFNKLGNTWKDTMLLGADTLTSAINQDIIGDQLYSGNTFFGNTPGTFTDASHWMGETVKNTLPTISNFILPGSGLVISGLQAAADPLIKNDQLRMQSKSGQDASKLGLALAIGGAAATAGTNLAGAGKSAAEVAKTAPKVMKTVADASKAAQAAGIVADAYNTAKDPDANWKDWTRVGLNAAGALGSNMSSTGMEGVRNVNNPFGSMQGIKDLQKFSSIAGAGDTLSNVAQAGKAGMSLYNTGENIDRYGLNSQTTMQGINALNQGLGAASNFSDNQNFQDFANTSNALGSAANFGMGLYNTANSGSKDTMDYFNSLPQGLYSAAQLNNLYGKRAMGGAVNAPNMMQYASGGNIGYNELDLTELSKQNNLMDNSRLLGYNLIGTDKFDAGSYVDNKKPTSMKEDYEMFLKAKPVTKYYSPAMPPHPKDGSMDPRGTVVGTIDPQTGKRVPINIEGGEGKWLLPNGEHFVTTKKDTKEILAMHKNGDLDGMATKMYNIKTAKEKKDAEAAAQQQARETAARQLEAMQMQAAKYGGMVNQYGYGGGVRMYGIGGPPEEEGTPYMQPNPYSTVPQEQYIGINPYARPLSEKPSMLDLYMSKMQQGVATNNSSNYVEAPPAEVVQSQGLQPYNFNTILTTKPSSKEEFLQGYTGNTFPAPDPNEQVDPNFVMPAQGPFMTERTYKSSEDDADAPLQGIVYTDAQGNEMVGNPYLENYLNAVTTEEEKKKLQKYLDKQNKKDQRKKEGNSFLDTALTAGQLSSIGYNLYNAIFGKPLNYHPAQIPKLTWMNRSGEPERRALKEAYATAKYGIPRGSGHLAERTQRAADYMNAMANLETNIANINNQGYMDTQAKNAGFTAQDIANEMTANQLNLQALANQQNLGATAVTQLGQLATSRKDANMYKNFYKTFSGGHYVLDKNGNPVYIKSSEETSDKKDKKSKKKDEEGK